jgi:hypothetical protein
MITIFVIVVIIIAIRYIGAGVCGDACDSYCSQVINTCENPEPPIYDAKSGYGMNTET